MSTRRISYSFPDDEGTITIGNHRNTPFFDIELIRGQRYIIWPDSPRQSPKLRGKFCVFEATRLYRQNGTLKATVFMEEDGQRESVDAILLLTEAQHAEWLADQERVDQEKAEVAARRAAKRQAKGEKAG